jgi:predicted transcriptional regulator
MNVEKSIEIMKALADTSRLMILNSLFEKAQYAEELSERIGLAASTISFHLKKMEEAGLVKKSKLQYYNIYEINNAVFGKTLEQFIKFDNIEKYAQEKRIEDYKQKVIKSFFNGKKLVRLPSQNMKKWIVLEVILQKFSSNKEYTEQEVNDIIKPIYNDYCTIRRALVDEKLMIRKSSSYLINIDAKDVKSGLRNSYEESMKNKYNKR